MIQIYHEMKYELRSKNTSNMKDIRIHYKSMFSVKVPKENEMPKYWNAIVRQVGSWIFEKFKSQIDCKSVISPWLFQGGVWHHTGLTSVKAETKLFAPPCDTGICPKYWTIRLQHPDNVYNSRTWCTDISLTITDKKEINVVVIVSYYFLPGYFGPIPADPIPNAPRIISYIFDSCNENLNVGTQRLYLEPQSISIGEGKFLVKKILDTGRLCPIILVRPDSENNINLDLLKLTQVLLGNVVIYYLENNEVYDEIKFYIARYPQYNCPVNALRIYQPKLKATNQNDYKRHRFFFLDRFSDLNELIQIVAQGIFRTQYLPFTDFITSIEDINKIENEYRLEQLKNNPDTRDTKEYYVLLEQENEILNAESRSQKDLISEFENEVIELKLEMDDNKREYNFNERQLTESFQTLQKEFSKIKSTSEIKKRLKSMPDSITDIVDIIEMLHPDRVEFLKEAKESAKDSKYQDSKSVWNLLGCIVTVLWEMYFDEEDHNTSNLEKDFKCLTGYPLTLKEGKQTKKDKELMNLRKIFYKNELRDFSPHIKINKKGLVFRVHYYADLTDKKIIIGHCGDHIEDYTTKTSK